MVCHSCGRSTQNEEANFCYYCGTSFRENNNVYEAIKQESTNTSIGQQGKMESETKAVSFKNWLGSMLLPFIPFIGWLIYIVMLFVWAFSEDTPQSKKNWARANLIVGIISIILIIYFLISVFMQVANSGMDINSYLDQLNSTYQYQ